MLDMVDGRTILVSPQLAKVKSGILARFAGRVTLVSLGQSKNTLVPKLTRLRGRVMLLILQWPNAS
jgi:hypothetical protein